MTTPLKTLAVCAFIALPGLASAQVQAQAQRHATDPLLDLLGIPETVEIMRIEGMDYADSLASDMLPGGPGSAWTMLLDGIYDTNRMEATVRAHFAQSYPFEDVNTAPLEQFFSSELGREIIQLEISARQAMSDEAVEELARQSYLERAEDPDARFDQIDAFVQDNDLVDANVVGGLNTTIRFYQGLADGGAIEMTEEEILREVWMSEEDTRSDTVEWVYGFLLMAYRPLSDAQLTSYAEMAATEEGRALNRALFAGFDKMYGDISYALGRAIAQQMQSEEL